MSLSSWFRRRRAGQRAALARHHEDTSVVPSPTEQEPQWLKIPLNPAPMVGFLVYFRQPPHESLPTERECTQYTREWITEHAPEPLGGALLEFVDEGFLRPQIIPRREMPEPPTEFLLGYNPGEIEERRFRDATHVALVGTPDLLIMPRMGYWGALATARALAGNLLGGVILDPEFPRLLPRNAHQEKLPSNGRLRVVEHVLVRFGREDPSGLYWLTTKGMMRFGLPDLELDNVPPNLVRSLLPVMNGMAQALADLAIEQADEREEQEEPIDTMEALELWDEQEFTLADVRTAYADENKNPLAPPDESPGKTPIRLALHLSPESPPRIRLCPPRFVQTAAGIWYNRVITDLFGSTGDYEPPENIAPVRADAPAVQAAHQAAHEELPLVRSRFQNGFQSGEVLYIKHGFPTQNGNREYMWINVTRWEDNGRIIGQLANDPRYRSDLQAGQEVEIGEDEVFDWMITHMDGHSEGGYATDALREQRRRDADTP